MSELTVLFFAIVGKYIAICTCIAGIVYLASNGKEGWGWLVFLAFCLATTSYKYTPDEKVDHGDKKEEIRNY